MFPLMIYAYLTNLFGDDPNFHQNHFMGKHVLYTLCWYLYFLHGTMLPFHKTAIPSTSNSHSFTKPELWSTTDFCWFEATFWQWIGPSLIVQARRVHVLELHLSDEVSSHFFNHSSTYSFTLFEFHQQQTGHRSVFVLLMINHEFYASIEIRWSIFSIASPPNSFVQFKLVSHWHNNLPTWDKNPKD